MDQKLSHINAQGEVHMVDVSAKATTQREAVAFGSVKMLEATRQAIFGATLAKGAVLGTARIAGIMAAKRTDELIPLCHSLGLDQVNVQFASLPDGIAVRAVARCAGKTGVEMEALTAVTVACLTIYDMAKAVDKAMVIGNVHLAHKTGGKSGNWDHPDSPREWPTEWS